MATAFQLPPEEEKFSSNEISWKKKLVYQLHVQGAIFFFLVALGLYGYGLSAFLPYFFGEGSVEWAKLPALLVAIVPMTIAWSLAIYRNR